MKEVSLVIPVKDEADSIQGLIDSISSQTLLPKEVIIVDGGSCDSTKNMIKNNIGKKHFDIRLIEVEKAYPGEGRNLGISQSRSELVAFTDAGIRLDERWLEELVRPMELDKDIDVVYGAYEPVLDSFIKECSLIAYIPPKEEVSGKVFRTNFIASSLFKKSICEKAGPFLPFRAAEDKIFMESVKRSGAKIAYNDKAIVHWDIPGSIAGIFKRFSAFSFHDLVAGRAKDWHYSIFRLYILLIVCVLLGVIVNPIFYWMVPAAWIIRMCNIYRNRKKDIRYKYIFDPRYLFTIMFIVLVTDAALFTGVIKYLCRK